MGVNKSIRVTSITKPVTIVMSFFGMVIISRVLSPEEIGIQVLAASIVLIVSELKNMGVGSLIMRAETLSQHLIAQAYTVLSITCCTIGLSLIAFSAKISNFFNEPRVENTIIVVALSFFLMPFYSITTAVLAREFNFAKIETMRVTEIALQQTIPIFLALNGIGYLSLPIGVLAASIVAAILAIILKPNIVQFRYTSIGIMKIFKMGGIISISSMLKRIAFQYPEILLGYVANAGSAAFYSRANGIPNFTLTALNDIVSPVVSPYFSRENQKESLHEAFVLTNKLMQSLLLPPLIVLSIYGFDIVKIVFGEKWALAGELLPIIALSLAIFNSIIFFEQLFIISKKESSLSFFQLSNLLITILLCSVFVILYDWQYIAQAILVSNSIGLGLKVIFIQNNFPGLLKHLFDNTKFNLIILALYSVIVFTMKGTFGFVSYPFNFILELGILAIAYITLLILCKHELINRIRVFLGWQ